MTKTEEVSRAVKNGDYKKALRIAKGFQIGVTQDQRNDMSKAYECMLYPDFYKQIGVQIDVAISRGIEVVNGIAQ